MKPCFVYPYAVGTFMCWVFDRMRAHMHADERISGSAPAIDTDDHTGAAHTCTNRCPGSWLLPQIANDMSPPARARWRNQCVRVHVVRIGE